MQSIFTANDFTLDTRILFEAAVTVDTQENSGTEFLSTLLSRWLLLFSELFVTDLSLITAFQIRSCAKQMWH
ncbi:hypothetical protein C0J52_26572 [Blattella germanica]|nr:hypothetical protein C0J52_26572 [Blattella germanica]